MMTIDRRAHPADARFSSWTAEDGWRLRVMDWPRGEGAPDRGSLLFLGGRGDFIEKYLEAMAHWRGRGWHITTFDWRGQGASRRGEADAPDPDRGFDPLVGDLAAFAAQWRAGHAGPHVVVAHSMGGHLLLRALAEHALAFDATVAVAPMIAINSGPIPAFVGGAFARLLLALGRGDAAVARDYQRTIEGQNARRNRLTSSAERYADEKWWHAREPGYDLGIPTWNWVAAAYRSMAKLTPEALSSITTPLLFLAARDDKLVDSRAIAAAARLIPEAEIVIDPVSAHEILRESDPVRLPALARIDAFFDTRAIR